MKTAREILEDFRQYVCYPGRFIDLDEHEIKIKEGTDQALAAFRELIKEQRPEIENMFNKSVNSIVCRVLEKYDDHIDEVME